MLDILKNTVRIILHYTNTCNLTAHYGRAAPCCIRRELQQIIRTLEAACFCIRVQRTPEKQLKKNRLPPYEKKMSFSPFGLLGVFLGQNRDFCIFARVYWKDNYPRDIKSRGKQLFYFDFCVWQAVPTGESRQQQAASLPFHRRPKKKKARGRFSLFRGRLTGCDASVINGFYLSPICHQFGAILMTDDS